MAKIENVVIHTLQEKEKLLKEDLLHLTTALQKVQTSYNSIMNQKPLVEEQLKQVQDAIALLSKPKKGKNASQD